MSFITPWRLKWYPAAVLIALAAAFFLFIVFIEDNQIKGSRLGGDFPAFYGAGLIVLAGEAADLYNVDRQLAAQEELLNKPGEFLCFAYPPFVALPYAALAMLPYRLAYAINTLVMFGALLLILKILFNKYEIPGRYYLSALALSLTFFPIFKALSGGQNTLLTFLLLCLAWESVDQNREIVAGVFLGLMMFKPQFALPMIGLMLLSRRWVAVLSSTATACCLYFICTLMLGTDWIVDWYHFALWFSNADATANSINAISWIGFFQSVLTSDSTIAFPLGMLLSSLTTLYISILWIKFYQTKNFKAIMPITCTALILIPPHAMYYESGLILLAVLSAVQPLKPFSSTLIAIAWLSGFSQIFAPALGFSPLFFVVLASLAGTSIMFFKENQCTRHPPQVA